MRFFLVIMCRNVFNMWPKTTLLTVWCRGAKRLDTLDTALGKRLLEVQGKVLLSESRNSSLTRESQMKTKGNEVPAL